MTNDLITEPEWEAYDPQIAWEWHDWAVAEIERLTAEAKEQAISMGWLALKNAKLQAVVDAAKTYFDEGGSYKRADVIDALAALEEDDA